MGYTMNDSDTRHNGWTNYATWRVNLEIFDGMDAWENFPLETRDGDCYSLSKQLEEYALDIVSDYGQKDGLAIDYARAFLADVNWHEIAEHMLEAAQADAA